MARIDWGDNSMSDGTAAINSRGGIDISGSHNYITAGTYSIRVELLLCASSCHGPPAKELIQQTITIS